MMLYTQTQRVGLSKMLAKLLDASGDAKKKHRKAFGDGWVCKNSRIGASQMEQATHGKKNKSLMNSSWRE
jgi:hypothetical protein